MDRVLQIAEEFDQEEAAIAILRTLKFIFRVDAIFDRLIDKYPSMGEFLN